MVITHNISMDLALRGVSPRIDVVQDDKYSRNIKIWLFENGAEFIPPGGCCPVIRYSKPDGTGGLYDTLPDGSCAWSLDRNALTISIAPQVCTAVGRVRLMVSLLCGSAELNTFVIGLNVQERVAFSGVSEDYVNVGFRIVFVTQAEYDALTEAEKEAGTYFITDQVPETDTTLTQSGKAADAKAVGDRLTNLETVLGTGLAELDTLIGGDS